MFNLRIRIRNFGDQQFDDFFVTKRSRKMQRSPSQQTTHSIHIRSSSDVLFDGFDVSSFGSIVN